MRRQTSIGLIDDHDAEQTGSSKPLDCVSVACQVSLARGRLYGALDGKASMKSCNYCGRTNEDTAVHCSECGTNLQADRPDSLPQISFRNRVATVLGRMTTKQKRLIVCAGVLLIGVAVYIASGYLHRPRMTVVEVIQIANAAAEVEGFRLSEYGKPDAKFEFPDRNRTCMVMYNLKLPTRWGPPLPRPQSAHGAPSHFFVVVDDKTKHTQVGMLQAIGEGEPVKPPPGVKILGHYTNQGWSDPNTK